MISAGSTGQERLIRRIALIAVAVVCAVVFSGGAASTSKRSPVVRHVQADEKSQAELAALKRFRGIVVSHRLQTWNCQDDLGVQRTRASVSAWALPASIPYRAWAAGLWHGRAIKCVTELQRRTIPSTGDWGTAVRLVQRIYPGTDRWLMACSSGEGGHGGFVMNHQGSGASGWLQYMPSTFYAHQDEAFADARSKGFVVDRVHQSLYDPIGQALTGAFMRTHGMSHHWDPRVDSLCA